MYNNHIETIFTRVVHRDPASSKKLKRSDDPADPIQRKTKSINSEIVSSKLKYLFGEFYNRYCIK